MGRQGSDLGGETGPPLLRGCLLTGGRGQVDALHDKQEHVAAAQVRKDPFGRRGNRGSASANRGSHSLQWGRRRVRHALACLLGALISAHMLSGTNFCLCVHCVRIRTRAPFLLTHLPALLAGLLRIYVLSSILAVLFTFLVLLSVSQDSSC